MTSKPQDAFGRVFRAAAAHLVGMVGQTSLRLLSVPILLLTWGENRYGSWLVLFSLAQQLVISDAGLGEALANELTILRQKNLSHRALRAYRSVSVFLFVAPWLLLFLLLTLAIVFRFDRHLNLLDITPREALLIAALGGIYVVFSFQQSCTNGALRAEGRYATGHLIHEICIVTEAGACMLLAISGASVVICTAAYPLTRMIAWLFLQYRLPSWAKWASFGLRGARFAEVRKLFAPGLGFVGVSLGHILPNQGILAAVGATLGPQATIILSTARTMVNVAFQLTNVLFHAVWQEGSRAYAEGLKQRLRSITVGTAQLSAAVSLLFALALMTIGPSFYAIWVHGKIPFESSIIGLLMAAGVLRAVSKALSLPALTTNRMAIWSAVFTGLQVLQWLLALLLLPRGGLLTVAYLNLGVESLLLIVGMPVAASLLGTTLGPLLRQFFGIREMWLQAEAVLKRGR